MPLGFVNRRFHCTASVPLVKVLLERLRRAIRALRVLRSTLTMLPPQKAALKDSRSASLSLRPFGRPVKLRHLSRFARVTHGRGAKQKRAEQL
jgi:hypothetical protein